MRKNISLVAVAALTSMLFLFGCGGDSKKENKDASGTLRPATEKQAAETGSSPYSDIILKLGRIPFTNPSEMVRKHELFLEYLTKTLGVKRVTLQTAPDYQSILNQLVADKIDIAWLATMTSVDARKKPDVELLVKPIRFGTTSYRGLIIARQDSGIRSLRDLKGKRFAWVEKESASAYIFPKAMLLEANIDPDKDFSEVAYLGKHDAVVYSVLLGKYDACACYDDARNTLKDPSKINELTIIGKTQDICNEPIVVRKTLPPDLIEKIKQALLDLNNKTPEGAKVLEHLTDVQGFAPVDARDYDYVEKVSKMLEGK
jgi:phosphonate transport system substrate-binding protein